jgi:hypothetical protein
MALLRAIGTAARLQSRRASVMLGALRSGESASAFLDVHIGGKIDQHE